jgi:NAD(P)-dependent dehydrogenase (short-subunit alcohol dehydrogenase family)
LSISSVDGPTENWRKIIELNVLGLSVCTKEALQSMKERGVDDGHIIHINRLVIKDNLERQILMIDFAVHLTHQHNFKAV